MATLAKIADELSRSPAVQKLPVAELGLQLERLSGSDIAVAAKNRAMAEMGLGSGSPAALAREAIIGSPASIIATTLAEMKGSIVATTLAEMDRFSLPAGLAGGDRYGIQQQLELISAGGAALQATFDRAIIPEGLFSSFSESVKVAMPKGLLAGIEASANLFGTIDHRAHIDSIGLSADTVAASLSAGRVFGQLDQEEWRAQVNAMLTPQVNWHEQLAGIYGSPGQSYEIVGLADAALWASQAPAVIARRPELPHQPPPKRLPPPPQSDNFGIQPAQPGQPAAWQEILADAIKAGRAKPFEVISLVAQVATLPPPAALLAELNELEALERAWLKVKRRHTPERFAKDQGMSKATLYRRWERLEVLRWLLVARG